VGNQEGPAGGMLLNLYFFLFLAHLMMYSNSDYIWNVWMTVNNKFDRMWKEVAVV
jgi:hypothetical protein